MAPCTVAKSGIKMLSNAMAAEWGARGMQANAVGPGIMLTGMNLALVDNPGLRRLGPGALPGAAPGAEARNIRSGRAIGAALS